MATRHGCRSASRSSPDGRHVYVANQGDDTIGVYRVGTDGTLTLASSADTETRPGSDRAESRRVKRLRHELQERQRSRSTTSARERLAVTEAPLPAVDGRSRQAGGHRGEPGWRQRLRDQPGRQRHRRAVLGRRGERHPDPEGAPTVDDRVWAASASSPPPIACTWPTSVSNTISQYDGRRRWRPAPARGRPSPPGTARSHSRSRPTARSLYVASFTDAASASTTSAATAPSRAKTPPSVPADSRPQAVVAVMPRDEQAPTVDLRTPPEGAQYALGADARADYSCADEGGSGLASCTGDVPDGDPLDTSTPGAHAFTVVARDGAGQRDDRDARLQRPQRRTSRRRPSICARRSQGAQYDVGADVRADYSCADEGGSGVASCTGDRARRRPAGHRDGRASTQFTVLARDGAGHETTVTHSYTVAEPPPPQPVLGFEGFFGPIHQRQRRARRRRDPDRLLAGWLSGAGHPGRRLAEQRAGRLPASRPGDGRRAGPEPVRSGPALQQLDAATTSSRGRPGSAWAGTCRTFVLGLRDGSVERLTVSFRSAWRWHRHRLTPRSRAPLRRLAAQALVLDLALELLQRAAQVPAHRRARRPARRPSPGCRSPRRRRPGAARRGCGRPARRAQPPAPALVDAGDRRPREVAAPRPIRRSRPGRRPRPSRRA